ncbi:MAG: hypothetical protein EOO73_23930 [Myxococcales bacterium]|nr:MAG: hypothetical protein EOO73_23930 [Myxococcales bacterium]
MSRARASCALLLLLLVGCCKRVESSECQLLLDHYVELLLRDDRPKSTAGEVLRLQQDARRKAQQDPAFAECSSRLSRRGYECAMQAEDANRLEQCLL